MELPHIPSDVPFTGEQKAWLAGFLAGLNTRIAMPAGLAPATTAPAAPQAAEQPAKSGGKRRHTGNRQTHEQDGIARGVLRELPLPGFPIRHDFDFLWAKESIYSEKYRRLSEELIRCRG